MRDVKSRGALLKAPKAVTFSAVSLTTNNNIFVL